MFFDNLVKVFTKIFLNTVNYTKKQFFMKL